jgi:hypothetical protein
MRPLPAFHVGGSLKGRDEFLQAFEFSLIGRISEGGLEKFVHAQIPTA